MPEGGWGHLKLLWLSFWLPVATPCSFKCYEDDIFFKTVHIGWSWKSAQPSVQTPTSHPIGATNAAAKSAFVGKTTADRRLWWCFPEYPVITQPLCSTNHKALLSTGPAMWSDNFTQGRSLLLMDCPGGEWFETLQAEEEPGYPIFWPKTPSADPKHK